MKDYESTEQAYKNGYDKGYNEATEKVKSIIQHKIPLKYFMSWGIDTALANSGIILNIIDEELSKGVKK